ncbi:MAG: undecaprenyl-phosphate glucose phosphotransferase [Candidatus Aminicenantes bacterium]|nr:undecaprenyl-phosphate glucose phosphotransferase [Candidatus Aminicenantes bacterium]
MIRKRRKHLLQLYLFSDIIAIIIGFNLTFWIRFYSTLIGAPKGIPQYSQYLLVIPLLVFIQVLYFSYQGFYEMKLRRNRLDDLFLVIVNNSISSFIIMLLMSYLRSYKFINFEISHLYLIIYIPLSTFLIFGLRLLVFKFFRGFFLKKNGMSKVLIAGSGDIAVMIAAKLSKYTHFGIEVIGFLNPQKKKGVVGNYDDLERIVKKYGVTDLFIALSLKEYKSIMNLIKTGNNLFLDIKLVPDILQIASIKAGMEHIEGIPTINLGEIPIHGYRLFFKRIFDILFSLVGIILLFPAFFIIGVLIKIDSRGPIFYVQKRVGLDGTRFKIIKFRTMIQNAEKETGAVWSKPEDKRITRMGRFLRKLSIDELPQLINVLKGDMSLVGPRPERPEFVEKFKNDIPKYMLRHRVKTGITGWAQVHGLRQNTALDKRIEFDIYYIQNWTFKLDLEILWRTVLKFRFIDKGKQW